MNRPFITCLFLIALFGCKKNSPSGVTIRIENRTAFTLDSVMLYYDTSNFNYGTIPPNQTSQYTYFKSMPDGPAANADTANTKILTGHLIPPNTIPIPMLAGGKYTLQIFPDSTFLYHLDAKFIKD
ncbi:MAG TPA: hypothetical protein VHB70_14755 [Parafilimonas sp.]|nr:hypothetical protein [Parafilimonas sp.]